MNKADKELKEIYDALQEFFKDVHCPTTLKGMVKGAFPNIAEHDRNKIIVFTAMLIRQEKLDNLTKFEEKLSYVL